MGFFTIGNLITLTIVILILLLYRQLDRKNRSLEKVRKFVDKVKEELDAYTDEKAVEVKNFGINLDVERKSALELMKRLQSLTEKDLAEKAAAIARIDERIHAYDTSLEELVRMTGRVQENLNRIRDESAFVEHAGRQVGEAKEKLNEMEKDLGGLLVRFEQENTEALNKAVEETLGAVKSTISNLETKAKTMALQVENHRETVEKVEQERKANLNKDIHTINTVLREAVEKAGTRADKMEETALIKLRDQAQDRVKRLQAAWEEKLKSTQETVKIRLAEIQEQFRSFRDEWKKEQGELEIQQKQYQESRKTEHEELETRQKQYREEWKKEIQNLNAQISRQNGEWNTAVSRQQENLNAAAARQQDEINTAMTRQREAFNAAIAKQQDEINAAITRQQEEVQKLDAQIGCQNGEWNTAVNRQQENLNAAAARQQDEINAAITRQREAFSAAIARQQDEINAAMTRQQEAWALITRDTEQRILAGSETQLEEYKRAQTEEFKQLAGLAGDVTRLDGELRLSMQETVNRVNADFISFEQEAARSREISAAEFTAQVTALKTEMDGVERELNTLKSQAYENVSEKLKLFEDDFFTDLNKRSGEIDLQLEEWHNGLENRLAEMAKTGEEEHREAVLRFNEEMRKTFTGQGERLTADLERLKAEAGAFEEGIREEMRAADETRQSLQEQLAQDLAEARRLAEDSAKNEIGRYSLSMAETLKQHQRELEEQLRGMTSHVEEKHHEITGVLEDSRRGMEEWQNNCTAQMRNLDASMDEARRRIRELVTENDERLVSVRASIEDIRKELSDETNLFDRAGKLRMELEQYIEDMGGTLDRLDQRRKEIAQLEDQLVQIKHLENDVNAKMTRFLSEKRRIEVMETDFNSLLQTSHEVEKKLAQVSSSDDTLQALQVQIRRLEDAIQETEKKYQRVEKKNQILEETNDGIARNFKALQESEETARQAGEELTRIAQEIDSLHAAVGVLAEDNGKARETIDKLGFLDESLTLIEKRISEMQTAREWLARTETRLAELDQQAQSQLRLTSSLLNKESGKPPASGTDTLPPRDRENIIKLHNQGWTIDQIAASYHRAKSEIELILEIGIRD
jgi:chromosome segregation ATPase